MAQNSWQRAKEREIAKGQITNVGEMYTQMIQAMAKEVINHKNTVIEALVKEELGVEVLLDMTEITRRGFLAPAVDGSEVFHWDNTPRIYFAPVDMVMKDDTMRPVLKWQRIPIIVEPDFTGTSEEFQKYLALARENNWHIPVSDLYKEPAWLEFWKECEEDQARISALEEDIGVTAATDDNDAMLRDQEDRARELHEQDKVLGDHE